MLVSPGEKASGKRNGIMCHTLPWNGKIPQDLSKVLGSQNGNCNVTGSTGTPSFMEMVQMSERFASVCSSSQYWSTSESDHTMIQAPKFVLLTPPTGYSSLISCNEKRASFACNLLPNISQDTLLSSSLFEPRTIFNGDIRKDIGPIPTIVITPPTPVNSLTNILENENKSTPEFQTISLIRCSSAPLFGRAYGTNIPKVETVKSCLSLPTLVNTIQASVSGMLEFAGKDVKQKQSTITLKILSSSHSDVKKTEQGTTGNTLCLPEKGDLPQKASLPPCNANSSCTELPTGANGAIIEITTSTPSKDEFQDCIFPKQDMISCTSSVSCPTLNQGTQDTVKNNLMRCGGGRTVRFASSLVVFPYENGPICNNFKVKKVKLDVSVNLDLDEERENVRVEEPKDDEQVRDLGYSNNRFGSCSLLLFCHKL